MQLFDFIKSVVLNFKFESCCWVAPVRIGLIITGYFNAITAIIALIATANATFPTTLTQVQTSLNEDGVTTSAPICAYITEIGFSVICLCGIYRKDLVLLRVYMYYCVAAIIMSIMVYSLAVLVIDLLIHMCILLGIVFQIYVLLLVRSAIVEIKWENKVPVLPTLVMSTLIKKEEMVNDHVENNLQVDQEVNGKGIRDKNDVKVFELMENNGNSVKIIDSKDNVTKIDISKDKKHIKKVNGKDAKENVKKVDDSKNTKDNVLKVKDGKDTKENVIRAENAEENVVDIGNDPREIVIKVDIGNDSQKNIGNVDTNKNSQENVIKVNDGDDPQKNIANVDINKESQDNVISIDDIKNIEENTNKDNAETLKPGKSKPEKVKIVKEKKKRFIFGRYKVDKKNPETSTASVSHEVKTDVEKALDSQKSEKKSDQNVEVKVETVNENVTS